MTIDRHGSDTEATDAPLVPSQMEDRTHHSRLQTHEINPDRRTFIKPCRNRRHEKELVDSDSQVMQRDYIKN